MVQRVILLAAGAVVALHGVAGEPPPPAPDDARRGPPASLLVQVCIGGLEDGKFIVRQGAVVGNHGEETTLQACRIDGGAPVHVPRPPTAVSGQPLVA